MRSELKRFPGIRQFDVDSKAQRVTIQAAPEFNEFASLKDRLESAGGEIEMFHARYLVPEAYFAMLGIRGHTREQIDRLQEAIGRVPGVRSVTVDPDRWFINEQGLDVGGAVVFADASPRLRFQMAQAALHAGFEWENRTHGHVERDDKEWSELTHAFSGLCVLLLAVIGMLQVGLRRPPALVRYGTPLIWLALFLFLFICADRPFWPLGPLPWWDGFKAWDAVGHRIGIAIILLLAVGDYFRIRAGWRIPPAMSRWGFLAIGLVGTWMLSTHLHVTLDPAHAGMVRRMNAQHLVMAVIALCFTVSKFVWDTWQVPHNWGRYLWLGFMALMGVALILYVE